MKDKMIRVGHFGILTEPQLKGALGALQGVLVEAGAAKQRRAQKSK
jgi:aspartate aminotransferase-like enzyme